jgi:hypothetical protein
MEEMRTRILAFRRGDISESLNFKEFSQDKIELGM